MAYDVVEQYPGTYHILDTEDGDRVARVSTFMPGPMVVLYTSDVVSPALARAVAAAMIAVADHIDTHGENA